MRKKKQNPEHLIAAIHASFNGYPLSRSQRKVLDEFYQTNSLDNLPVDWEIIKQMDGADERARQGWACLEKKIKELPQQPVLPPRQAVVRPLYRYKILIKAAIVVGIIVIGAVAYHFYSKQKPHIASVMPTETGGTDHPPGSMKATLILSDNSFRILTDKQQGIIATDGGIAINNSVAGMLTYTAVKGNDQIATGINCLITPRAGIYQVVLPDKTIMYLNAESTVKYPTRFTGAVREVILERGEAFFDVAHDNKPFIVKVLHKYKIEVFGTRFNVNTYADEGTIKTTLVDGSIKLDNKCILKPGEQAIMSSTNDDVQIRRNVDTTGEISWKNGFFSFSKLDLISIMKQAERWYDVTIKLNEKQWLTDSITHQKIPRTYSLDKFLNTLSFERFDYTIKNKEVTINKK